MESAVSKTAGKRTGAEMESGSVDFKRQRSGHENDPSGTVNLVTVDSPHCRNQNVISVADSSSVTSVDSFNSHVNEGESPAVNPMELEDKECTRLSKMDDTTNNIVDEIPQETEEPLCKEQILQEMHRQFDLFVERTASESVEWLEKVFERMTKVFETIENTGKEASEKQKR